MNIYHLLNRGVDKRKVFLSDRDFLRFAHNLCDFNNSNNVMESYYRRRWSDVRHPTGKRKKLVDVLCWSALPNHPHIMVGERVGGNAGKFSRKIFGGYTKYFNEQNSRSGVLFQGRSKIILVKENKHFLYLSYYIHSNPLDVFQSDWREKGLKNPEKAIMFLERYQWSSYLDIIGIDNFSDIINKELFFEVFAVNSQKYKKNFLDWLIGYKRNYQKIKDILK